MIIIGFANDLWNSSWSELHHIASCCNFGVLSIQAALINKYLPPRVVAWLTDWSSSVHPFSLCKIDAHIQSCKGRVKLCLPPIPLLHPACYIHCFREDPWWCRPPSPTNPIPALPQPNRAQVLPAALLLLPTGKRVYIVLEKTIQSTRRACVCLSLLLQTALCNSHLQGRNK